MAGQSRSVGSLIGERYRILNVIGRGGMGEVFAAQDEVLDRRVAVKLMHAASDGEEWTQRFRREARALARISHPNAVAVHDFGVHDSNAYLVMELLDGLDLRSMIRQGPLAAPLVRAVVTGMCAGLAAAHEAGVLHRDIKPGNVHLTRAGRVVLQDFGIATMLWSGVETTLTRTGHIIGTPQYMPPESIRGQQTGPAGDLYSLGVCTYVMLSGREPYEGTSAYGVIYNIINETRPDIAAVVPGIPPDLASLVTDLLRKDPAERPSMDEVVARLHCPPQPEALIASAITGGVRGRAVSRLTDDVAAAGSIEPEHTWRPSTRPSTTPYVRLRDGIEPAEADPSLRSFRLSQLTREHILRAMAPEAAEARLREAVGLVQRGELADADELLAAVHAVCRSALGAEHPTTLTAHYWRAVCLARLGASAEALTAFSTVADRAAGAIGTTSAQQLPGGPAGGLAT
ncbi:serine/threonine-protein kinase [Streptomyces odontomachi]|uniref:serine/threonine-protein kinase n=1 Tax=Streptomyces odontomachi TaxID=2944940 RepID=UPI00210AD6CE|nr:serine/threonine-protein kinase [Streptomyces sp. ODS25]